MDMLINSIVAMISQCVCLSKHHVVNLKYSQFLFANCTSIKQRRGWERIQRNPFFPHISIVLIIRSVSFITNDVIAQLCIYVSTLLSRNVNSQWVKPDIRGGFGVFFFLFGVYSRPLPLVFRTQIFIYL